MARQTSAFGAHPLFEIDDDWLGFFLPHIQPVAGRQTVDPALDREDLVDAPNHLDGQWRLAEITQLEEVAPAMAPARRLGDRAGFAFAIVELAEAGIGVGLKDAGVAGQVPGGMLAGAIARINLNPAVDSRRGSNLRPGLQP